MWLRESSVGGRNSRVAELPHRKTHKKPRPTTLQEVGTLGFICMVAVMRNTYYNRVLRRALLYRIFWTIANLRKYAKDMFRRNLDDIVQLLRTNVGVYQLLTQLVTRKFLIQIRGYGRFKLKKAINDRIPARIQNRANKRWIHSAEQIHGLAGREEILTFTFIGSWRLD